MTTTTKIPLLKHNQIDAHLRYTCDNASCRIDHWLSLKEAQTTNFKIVCDCGAVYRPKPVSSLKVRHKTKKLRTTETADKAEIKEIPVDILTRGAKILVGYGFTQDESESLVKLAYSQSPTADFGLLIKLSLSLFGGSHG
jgi:hypothetical protein